MAPSSRVCSGITQMARAAASTGSCPFLQFGSGGRVCCRCRCSRSRSCRCGCWAGLQWRSCERTDSNCPLSRSLAHMLVLFSPSPLRPLRKSEGGSRSTLSRPLSPSCRLSRGLFEHSQQRSGPRHSVYAERHEVIYTLLLGPRSASCALRLSGRSMHTQNHTTRDEGGLPRRSKPGSPDPSVSEAALYCRYCIRPSHPPKQGTRQPRPDGYAICRGGGGRINSTLYLFLDAKTQPAHTPLQYITYYGTHFSTCTQKLGSCATHRPHPSTSIRPTHAGS